MKPKKDIEITEVVEEALTAEEIQDATNVGKGLIPNMNVSLPGMPEEDKLIPDEKLLEVYSDIIKNIKEDRDEITEMLTYFTNVVINEGDATTSSKEAVVNLIKIKTDTSDKLSKVADLMTRARGISTYKPYFNAKQNNTINIEAPKKDLTLEEKKALIEAHSKKHEKDII